MKLQKRKIKEGPSPFVKKVESLGDYAATVKSYVTGLRSVDIQPEYIIKHADMFRELAFKYEEGMFIERKEWEVLNATIDNLTKQVKELTEQLSKGTAKKSSDEAEV